MAFVTHLCEVEMLRKWLLIKSVKFQRTRIQSPNPTTGGSQPPETPGSIGPVLAGLHGHLHILQTHTLT